MNNFISTKTVRTLALAALTALTGLSEAQHKWGPAGPIYTAGRVRNMVVDISNSSILYVGSSTSGIFKSTDAGSNWSPIDDQGNIRNISYLAQAKDGIIYAGTGEGFLRYSQKGKVQTGTGLYKLSGSSLTQVVSSAAVGTVINRIACSPVDEKKIALATNLGIYITTDGTNFSPVASVNATANVAYGMDVKFDNTGVLYCTVGNERGHTPYNTVASKVYKSTDASLSAFSNITPTSSVLSDFNYGRIELAISPSENNVIYASCANKNVSPVSSAIANSATLKALYVSYDGGANWQLIIQGSPQLDPLSNGGTQATGDYAHVVVVSPSNPDMIFIGSYQTYVFVRTNARTSTQGPLGNWIKLGSRAALNTPYYLHENVHDIKIIGGNPTKFFFITDAGIFRSVDLVSTNQVVPPSFQPFYKGLVTGQFNSVSIESFPIIAAPVSTVQGSQTTPYFGYIGGTAGNGLTYYSGTSSLVTQENSYLSGVVYNTEYSKILTEAAFFTIEGGGFYRMSDARTSEPALVAVNSYKDPISKLTPVTAAFSNANASTGTPFKLWENYGNRSDTPDSVIFYNDTLRFQYSMSGVPELTTRTTFTFSAARPNKFAQIDSIAIRTGTVVLPSDKPNVWIPFTGSDKKDITLKLTPTTVPVKTIAVPFGTTTVTHYIQVYNGPSLTVQGPANNVGNAAPSVTLNQTSLLDEISVTFTGAPFASKSATTAGVTDPAAYYRVFATVFYKYKTGDTVNVVDKNVSTKTGTYTSVLTRSLNWAYGDSASRAPVNGLIPLNKKNNPPVMIKTSSSARLAMSLNSPVTGNQTAIVVSKAPLNLNDPLNFVRVSQSGCWTDDANGVPTKSIITYAGQPTILEWSKRGTELYFATNDNKLYRVSHITRLMDLSASSYNGKFNTDVFRYDNAISSSFLNPESPYRTTLIGEFNRQITSISVSADDKNLLLTLNGTTTFTSGTSAGVIMYNNSDARTSNTTNINWVNKDGGAGSPLQNSNTYCSLLLKNDNKQVYVGTDNGIVYTSDITAGTVNWVNANNNQLPNVQVFDIEQQMMDPWECYNSGEIYVATNGRGVWSNRSFFVPYTVGIEETVSAFTNENGLIIYPNPSNDKVNIVFNGRAGERAGISIYDINGREVHNDRFQVSADGENLYTFQAGSLNSGVYIISMTDGTGNARMTKLIVTK